MITWRHYVVTWAWLVLLGASGWLQSATLVGLTVLGNVWWSHHLLDSARFWQAMTRSWQELYDLVAQQRAAARKEA